MKKILIIPFCLSFHLLIAQPSSLFLLNNAQNITSEIKPEWKQNTKIGIDLSEVTFSNWNAGGSNSVAALFNSATNYDYKDKYFTWKNSLVTRYGINKQQDKELRKTEDLIEINSNIGYKPDSLSNWYYSARLNFKTQFTNGYKYPDIDNPISKFMAPGYLFFGGGMEYAQQREDLSFYVSPMTLKTTFVLDKDLADSGAFGVDPAVRDDEGNIIVEGKRVQKEVGILMTNSYEMQVVENITVKHIVSLYTDYINSFGNVDVDWQINFDFKVNNFMRATFGSHLRYDDDVKTTTPSEIEGEFDEAGARTQWKQFLGIGFALDF